MRDTDRERNQVREKARERHSQAHTGTETSGVSATDTRHSLASARRPARSRAGAGRSSRRADLRCLPACLPASYCREGKRQRRLSAGWVVKCARTGKGGSNCFLTICIDKRKQTGHIPLCMCTRSGSFRDTARTRIVSVQHTHRGLARSIDRSIARTSEAAGTCCAQPWVIDHRAVREKGAQSKEE